MQISQENIWVGISATLLKRYSNTDFFLLKNTFLQNISSGCFWLWQEEAFENQKNEFQKEDLKKQLALLHRSSNMFDWLYGFLRKLSTKLNMLRNLQYKDCISKNSRCKNDHQVETLRCRKLFGKLEASCPAKIVRSVSEIYSFLVFLPFRNEFWRLNLCEFFLDLFLLYFLQLSSFKKF